MKVFVIAQHHGVMLTLNSLLDSGIKDFSVIIPTSQVEKYNKMYNENTGNPDFEIFKNFDKRVKKFADLAGVERGASISVFSADNFDVRNTVASMLNILRDGGITSEKVSCQMAGTITLKDYRSKAEQIVNNPFGFCFSRVYGRDRRLSMYHMLGLPKVDNSLDNNFFVIDMSKIENRHFVGNDRALLSEAQKNKQITYLPREFNFKDDILIGDAISARETVCHNLRASRGYNLNFWNKSMQPFERQKSEEIFGYPYDFYSKYAMLSREHLPQGTVNKIIENGSHTEKYVKDLRTCIDIIDLINT